jgi:hypothetical protein
MDLDGVCSHWDFLLSIIANFIIKTGPEEDVGRVIAAGIRQNIAVEDIVQLVVEVHNNSYYTLLKFPLVKSELMNLYLNILHVMDSNLH